MAVRLQETEFFVPESKVLCNNLVNVSTRILHIYIYIDVLHIHIYLFIYLCVHIYISKYLGLAVLYLCLYAV